MAGNWNYADYVKKAKAYGGPEQYLDFIQKTSYHDGYQSGKGAGLHKGIMVMIPFVIGTCYLIYDKVPRILRVVRDKIHFTKKAEVQATEQAVTTDKVSLALKCPYCGKEANDIDEIIKTFGFDKTTEGELVPKRFCKECGNAFYDKFYKN